VAEETENHVASSPLERNVVVGVRAGSEGWYSVATHSDGGDGGDGGVIFFFATKLNNREQLVAETVRRRRDRFYIYIVREMR
jgi:hypothetical protein